MRAMVRALPERIWIVGPCGSGKSTLARRLADLQGIEATSLDEIHWRPGWVEAPREETAARIAEVVARPRWVIDGNYGSYRRHHLDRVDLIVWLDFRLHVTFPRLLRRGIRRSLRREVCCNGNYETLRLTFCDPESLLWYALTTDARRRRGLRADVAGRRHVRFTSQRDVDRWLDTLVLSAPR